MHALCKGFCQPVSECFRHYCAVVVVGGLESRDHVLESESGADGEGTQMIRQAGIPRRDEVGEGQVGASGATIHLLSEGVEGGEGLAAIAIGIDDNIVVDARRRPDADDRPCPQPSLVDDTVKHFFGIGKQFTRCRAHGLVVEDARKTSSQIPASKEWPPVDVLHQFIQGVIIKAFPPGERWRWWCVVAPVDGVPIGACLVEGRAAGLAPLRGPLLSDGRVFRCHL